MYPAPSTRPPGARPSDRVDANGDPLDDGEERERHRRQLDGAGAAEGRRARDSRHLPHARPARCPKASGKPFLQAVHRPRHRRRQRDARRRGAARARDHGPAQSRAAPQRRRAISASSSAGRPRPPKKRAAPRRFSRPWRAAPIAGRSPTTTQGAARLLRRGPRRRAASTPASSWRCSGFWSARHSCSAPSSRRRRAPGAGAYRDQRPRARLAAVVLPVEQHSRRRAARPGDRRASCTSRRCSSGRRGGCSPIRARRRSPPTSRGSGCRCAGCRTSCRTRFCFPTTATRWRWRSSGRAELFFDSIVREDRPALDLLTANYTFVNERLAQHYGIPNVKGINFRASRWPTTVRVAACSARAAILTRHRAARTAPRRSCAASGCSRTCSARRRRSRRRTCRRSRRTATRSPRCRRCGSGSSSIAPTRCARRATS